MATAGTARKTKRRAAAAEPPRRLTWTALTLLVLGTFLALRLTVNAFEPVPVHFDEAQYWAYGQALDWGYFSKPPLVGAVMRLATDLMGDTLFAMRLFSPLSHALVAWMIFLTGSRVWDGRSGFWAATGYTLAPGVTFSALLGSTDPLMMACWAVALYALIRGLETRGRFWWLICGIAIGCGMMAKYTTIAFPLAAAGFMALSAEREQRDWRGFGLACGIGLLIVLPNIIWNAVNSFATFVHVAEDANASGPWFRPDKLAEFLGAQLGVIGPPFFLALVAALALTGRWRNDWGMRLMAWQCWLLLGAMIVLAFLTRANGNWAAPAYIGGALMAARFLLSAGWRGWLVAQVALGATAALVLYLSVGAYALRAAQLPVAGDPFWKIRLGPAFCNKMEEAFRNEGAAVMLSNSRHRLSECMWENGLDWNEIAVWNPELAPSNHHELVSTLRAGDDRRMILAVKGEGARVASRFERSRLLERSEIRTHGNRTEPFELWFVQDFRGYD